MKTAKLTTTEERRQVKKTLLAAARRKLPELKALPACAWDSASTKRHRMANDKPTHRKQPPPEPIYHNGCFRRSVDAKLRVRIPVKWRPNQSGARLAMILLPWPRSQAGMCLRVIPSERMAELKRNLNSLPKSDPRRAILIRFLHSETVPVTPDRSGRICLPKEMMTAAGIGKDAMLVGLLDRFEIWNVDLFNTLGLFE